MPVSTLAGEAKHFRECALPGIVRKLPQSPISWIPVFTGMTFQREWRFFVRFHGEENADNEKEKPLPFLKGKGFEDGFQRSWS